MRWPTIIPLTLIVVMVGCGPITRYVYTKPGVTAEQRERDEFDCRRQAIVTTSGAGESYEAFDQNLFNRCMVSRGYEVQEIKK